MKPLNVLSLFDGKYDVTSDGFVYSNVGRRKRLTGKVTSAGYNMVVLTVQGKKMYPNVHRLVAESFIPNPNNLPQVNHKDGIKHHNYVDNLEWSSPTSNLIHARDTGLQKTKINMEIANQIRSLYKAGGITQVALGEMFGIKKTQVGYIINNLRWKI